MYSARALTVEARNDNSFREPENPYGKTMNDESFVS